MKQFSRTPRSELRVFSNSELVTALRSFKVSEHEIQLMTRWQKLYRIQEEATAAVATGIPTAYAKFARRHYFSVTQRHSS